MDNKLEEKLKELKKEYFKKLESMLLNFKSLLTDENINIEEIYSKVHKISGTSGMYGISDLSEASTELELYLKPLRENPDNINLEELKNNFTNYLDYIGNIISEREKNGKSSFSR